VNGKFKANVIVDGLQFLKLREEYLGCSGPMD
jgi:hypothetical protein